MLSTIFSVFDRQGAIRLPTRDLEGGSVGLEALPGPHTRGPSGQLFVHRQAEYQGRFKEFYDPDLGNCYTFTPLAQNGEEELRSTEADVWQKMSDLVLVVNVETSEYLEPDRDAAVLVTFHSPEVYPDPSRMELKSNRATPTILDSKKKIECAERVSNETKEYCRSLCRVPCKNNLAHVRAYFTTMEESTLKHSPKYQPLEMFSHIGGYVGIWLGISLLALCEFIEGAIRVFFFHSQSEKAKKSKSTGKTAQLGQRQKKKPILVKQNTKH
ncbi:amiloride-sensitive sodium channel subunit beta-2 [Caerostris extrusa]|uniref:Amiloride-sensitive sodium channel subunit beta-2 n=1 Tax=Caerostris extrusa TaxID=172846 RepID=A0AAV4NH47_CAEEX|nr:amiloride-sensitive sodium channel subunit beta-2 [Caerostris extrusa]